MRTSWLFLALFLATAAAGAASADDQPDCRLHLLASLDLHTDASGEVYVVMGVNGHDERMLVDTGGLTSMLSESVVNTLGLTRRHFEPEAFYFTQYGGIKINTYGIADHITLGTMHGGTTDFVIMPDEDLPAGLDGTLAPDILSTFDVEFDFEHGKMNLFRQKHCPGQVVYWTRQPYARIPIRVSQSRQIFVDAALDGHQARAILDTGSSWTLLSLEAARQEFGWDKDPAGLKPAAGEKATDPHAYVYPFDKIIFGGIAVGSPAITLVPDKYAGFGHQRFEPIIGISILRQMHLYIAYGEGNLYATSADAN